MKDDFKKNIGQKLQIMRLKKNLTQEQMGERLNISTSAYCKIEYGETDITLTRLIKIAEVFTISEHNLFRELFSNDQDESADPFEQLQELIKANSRSIELLCQRISTLEKRMKK